MTIRQQLERALGDLLDEHPATTVALVLWFFVCTVLVESGILR